MRGSSRLAGLAALLLVLWPLACAPSDPQAAIHKQRARWTVQPLEWLQAADGSIQLSARLSGPPNSKIDSLTVRIDLLDPAGQPLRQDWHTFDLTQIPRGGPKDLSVRLGAIEGEVGSLAVDLVLDPTPEEARHIPELEEVS